MKCEFSESVSRRLAFSRRQPRLSAQAVIALIYLDGKNVYVFF